VQVEIAARFFALGRLGLSPMFGLTVGETIGRGLKIVALLPGPLAGQSKIHEFSHCPVQW
jgi:hypothetical protein